MAVRLNPLESNNVRIWLAFPNIDSGLASLQSTLVALHPLVPMPGMQFV